MSNAESSAPSYQRVPFPVAFRDDVIEGATHDDAGREQRPMLPEAAATVTDWLARHDHSAPPALVGLEER